MDFIPSLPLINKAAEGGYAIPSFCVWNAETMKVVLQVASDCKAPVMLMNGPAEFGLLSPAQIAATARAIAAPFDVPAALHLDHGDSIELVEACLAANYTSIMLDYSTRPFEENASALERVVSLAKEKGATVEGEIGAVGRVDNVTGEGTKSSSLTDPVEAEAYVDRTGLDMVAVAIGNAHGNYPTRPRLDFDLLATLRDRVAIPLVLHGGSGTPAEDLKKAINLGIAKINVASELVRAVRDTLLNHWSANEMMWAPVAFADAMKAMAPVVEKWIHQTGAAGQA